MENHYFQWVNPLQMAIFNSYVELPEGINSQLTSHIVWAVAAETQLR